MKLQISVLLFLTIVSCKKATDKENEQIQIAVDSTELKVKTVEKSTEVVETHLRFEEVSKIIKSNFGVEKLQSEKTNKRFETAHYKLIDSTKVKSYKEYSELIIIEFENSNDSKIEFKKIKTIAEKSQKDIKELFDYHGVFGKGGVSVNKVDKWIISHFLRCNMSPKDHEVDKNFTSELEKLDGDVDWIKSYCGWVKMELK